MEAKGNVQPSTASLARRKRWESLAWADVEAWAGPRDAAKGRAYQRQHRVHDLARADDGRLLATVVGSGRYVTTVGFQTDDVEAGLASECTCPLRIDGCKHAAAVVAEYLDRRTSQKIIPPLSTTDRRWKELDGEYDEAEQDEEPAGERPVIPVTFDAPPADAASDGVPVATGPDARIEQHVRKKTQAELADLVLMMTHQYPELREVFRERIELTEGSAARLVAEAKKELRRVTAQQPWTDRWHGTGYTPDYGPLTRRLERLVELGHVDEVATLAPEVIERTMAQVGSANDDGETGAELARCLPVVFKAVAASSLAPAVKIQLAVDAELADPYELIGEATAPILDAAYTPADWSVVADEMGQRLGAVEARKRDALSYSRYADSYGRDRISGYMVHALEKAGRNAEVRALYEREAERTGSYQRLVKYLFDQGEEQDAVAWALKGIGETAEGLPGIAAALAVALREHAVERDQWDVVAAHDAWAFFEQPSRTTHKELLAAAKRARCGPAVQDQAMRFLETGVAPYKVFTPDHEPRSVEVAPDWPLPVPAYLLPLRRATAHGRTPEGPRFDVLMDLALADKDNERLLRWYDAMRQQKKQPKPGQYVHSVGTYDDYVAAAVTESHPRRALDIYLRRMNEQLPHANNNAYEAVANYLRKMRPIIKAIDPNGDWTGLIDGMREQYRNRPRFIDVLNRLEKPRASR